MDIALDFDGTLVTHSYPHVGLDIGAQPILAMLYRSGHRFILNTMRSDDTLADAVKWCNINGIPLKGINEHPTQKSWTNSPKIYSQLYLDDAALGIPLILTSDISDRPYVDWTAVHWLLLQKNYITCFPYSQIDAFAYLSTIPNLEQSGITKEDYLLERFVNEGVCKIVNNQIEFIGEFADVYEKYFHDRCLYYETKQKTEHIK